VLVPGGRNLTVKRFLSLLDGVRLVLMFFCIIMLAIVFHVYAPKIVACIFTTPIASSGIDVRTLNQAVSVNEPLIDVDNILSRLASKCKPSAIQLPRT